MVKNLIRKEKSGAVEDGINDISVGSRNMFNVSNRDNVDQ